ncbi:LPFR motif small protein [Streptomyces litchfieldiae]|uniref:LPFR motif small protein n=1 Tax=Streptomyces litchfieldiae TaxID=3075543 RepID=A0ABU2MN93_9ACTN|nr:LPFR motif small protein [Streptomyces sp. DSM 44938]MDT0343076.1 LPFR motif small protein [Streptomyces sp. DSM 44938]
MLRAIADVLRTVGGAVAMIVSLPFRLLARLFGGVSDTVRGRH